MDSEMDPEISAAVRAVDAMLAGGPGLLLPHHRSDDVRTFMPAAFDPAGTPRSAPALVLFTSGSTGAPKGVGLGRDALIASARATEAQLAGPGRWHLCLPVNHIAGLQVVLRALLAGAPPTTASATGGGFQPEVFADDLSATLAAAGEQPVYTSLVPTQLARILDVPRAARALARTAAVLLGGSSMSPRLLERAHDWKVPIVRTYGMSETAGGCVYDGSPFPDVTVQITADGQVALSGPVLADGYVQVNTDDAQLRLTALPHAPAVAPSTVLHRRASLPHLPHLPTGFHGEGADRLLVTSDLGRWDDARRLAILGRSDDVIISGGDNVSPHEVETALLPIIEPLGFTDALLTSRTDDEWGEALVVLLVPELAHSLTSGTGDVTDLVATLRRELRSRGFPQSHLPRTALIVDALPIRSIGKPDRVTARALAHTHT